MTKRLTAAEKASVRDRLARLGSRAVPVPLPPPVTVRLALDRILLRRS